MGCECSPPLTANQIDGAIQQSKHNRKHIRDSTIADCLNVTPEEAQYVPRWADHRTVPELSCRDMNLKYMQRADHRRQSVREILDVMGRVPSCLDMAELLRQRGIQISNVLVSRDYLNQQIATMLTDRTYSIFRRFRCNANRGKRGKGGITE